MDAGEIIALTGVFFVGIGLLATWRRNGKDLADRDREQIEKMSAWKTEIKSDLDHINEELKSPNHGLTALKAGQSQFENHCAKVSTRLAGMVEVNARDIDELKRKN